jgi:hypothetical protein
VLRRSAGLRFPAKFADWLKMKAKLGFGFQQPRESSSASPPHRPREDGLARPADTSRPNLAAALALLSSGGSPNPSVVAGASVDSTGLLPPQ